MRRLLALILLSLALATPTLAVPYVTHNGRKVGAARYVAIGGGLNELYDDSDVILRGGAWGRVWFYYYDPHPKGPWIAHKYSDGETIERWYLAYDDFVGYYWTKNPNENPAYIGPGKTLRIPTPYKDEDKVWRLEFPTMGYFYIYRYN